MMLDLNFEVEGCDTFESDGNDLLALCFSGAVTVCFSRLVEPGTWARMHCLPDGDGREVLLRVIVLRISKLEEGVFISARIGCICADRRGATSSVKCLFAKGDQFAFLVLVVLSV